MNIKGVKAIQRGQRFTGVKAIDSFDALRAAPSYDMWSFGCVLFRALARQPLINVDAADNARDAFELSRLHNWSSKDIEAAMQVMEAEMREHSAATHLERIAACDVLASLLAADASSRPSADVALQHAFFDDLSKGTMLQSDLHVVAALGNDAECHTLLRQGGCDSTLHPLGKTPLHAAAEALQPSTIELLLANDPNAHETRDANGNSALTSLLNLAENDYALAQRPELSTCLEQLAHVSDLSTHKDGDGRSAAALGEASQHVSIREKIAQLQEEQQARSVRQALTARPPLPFDIAVFDELWEDELTRPQYEALVFAALEQWCLARPTDTAESDRAANQEDTSSMKPKKKYLERCIFPLAMFAEARHFERMRAIATQRSEVVLAQIFRIRDNLKASAAGEQFVNLPSLDWPDIRQPLRVEGVVEQLELPSLLAGMVAYDEVSVGQIDSHVVIPLMRVHAEKVLPAFSRQLQAIIPRAKLLEDSLDRYAMDEILISVAPVKGPQRMQVCSFGGGEGRRQVV